MSGLQVKTSRFENGVRGAYLIVGAIGGFLCVAVALVSYRYLLRAGGVPPVIEGNLFIEPWLMVHVAGAATAVRFTGRSGVRTSFHAWLAVRPVLCSH